MKSSFRKRVNNSLFFAVVFIFLATLLLGYNNCAPQIYSNTQSSFGGCNLNGYMGPTLLVKGQLIAPQNATAITIHANIGEDISFSLLDKGAPVVCGPTNGQSYWVLPTGQQITNNCITQAIAAVGTYIYTYHATEFINGNDCPPAVNNVSVQIAVP